MWQHNFTIATVVKLLTKCLCSESSLHSLPSRSSWCPRPSKPAYYIVDCWILRVAKGLLSMYICIVHRREKKKLAKNVNAIPPLAAANQLRVEISTFLKKLWINFHQYLTSSAIDVDSLWSAEKKIKWNGVGVFNVEITQSADEMVITKYADKLLRTLWGVINSD